MKGEVGVVKRDRPSLSASDLFLVRKASYTPAELSKVAATFLGEGIPCI